MNELLIDVGKQVFTPGQFVSDHRQQLRDSREALLAERLRLRRRLEGVTEEEEEHIAEQLRELSKSNRKLRRREREQQQNALVAEINEHWRARRLAEASRLARRLAGSRWGPKKRDYQAVRG
eukprot:9470550-Pyramimonas_sp.AAC.1